MISVRIFVDGFGSDLHDMHRRGIIGTQEY